MKRGSDPERFDERMLEHYDAGLPKWTRERRRQRGLANFRYLRHGEWFIVLVTEGKAERFWREDKHRTRDVRAVPIRFKGYSISLQQGGYKRVPQDERVWRNAMWSAYRDARERGEKGEAPPPAARDSKHHVHVRLDEETYAGMKAYFLNIATTDIQTSSSSSLFSRSFRALVSALCPVRVQLRNILRAVNEARTAAGYDTLPLSVIRFKRRIVKAFVEVQKAA